MGKNNPVVRKRRAERTHEKREHLNECSRSVLLCNIGPALQGVGAGLAGAGLRWSPEEAQHAAEQAVFRWAALPGDLPRLSGFQSQGAQVVVELLNGDGRIRLHG